MFTEEQIDFIDKELEFRWRKPWLESMAKEYDQEDISPNFSQEELHQILSERSDRIPSAV